jgi:uncharacterized membrane protein SpoIIM required for sporulation
MTVEEMVKLHAAEWQALEDDIAWLRGPSFRRRESQRILGFSRRYRAACSDLALAIAGRFPPETTDYLHQLVADAHSQLYRTESFSFVDWVRSLVVVVPRRIVTDPCFWIALGLFWSLFLGAGAAAILRPSYAVDLVGTATLAKMEEMYTKSPSSVASDAQRSMATGFYVFNNAGIGLRAFVGGILGGVGSLVILGSNAVFLGVIFGHMLTSPQRANFVEFVTAHGPFELTAVVLSAAAGLRLGWALLDTRGWSRLESLQRTAPEALSTAGLATVLFILAAFIEGFGSPSTLPYRVKAAVAVGTAAALVAYFLAPLVVFGVGRGRTRPDET